MWGYLLFHSAVGIRFRASSCVFRGRRGACSHEVGRTSDDHLPRYLTIGDMVSTESLVSSALLHVGRYHIAHMSLPALRYSWRDQNVTCLMRYATDTVGIPGLLVFLLLPLVHHHRDKGIFVPFRMKLHVLWTDTQLISWSLRNRISHPV